MAKKPHQRRAKNKETGHNGYRNAFYTFTSSRCTHSHNTETRILRSLGAIFTTEISANFAKEGSHRQNTITATTTTASSAFAALHAKNQLVHDDNAG